MDGLWESYKPWTDVLLVRWELVTNTITKLIIQVEFHQGLFLNLLLFIIDFQILTEKFEIKYPCRILYADKLIIIAGSVLELEKKFQVWKQNLELDNFQS